jgi:hypothetical protein
MLQVWNDNAPLPDSLIGSVKLQLDAPTLLALGAQGKAYELELTMPDKPTAKRGKLRLTAAAVLIAEPPKLSKPEPPASVSSAKPDSKQVMGPEASVAAKTAEAKGAIEDVTAPAEDKGVSKQVPTPAAGKPIVHCAA